MSDFTGKVAEETTLVYDFGPDLERIREADYQYGLGEFITIGAFVYECTSAGKTSGQPLDNVPTVPGQTFDDGSVEWTCRDFDLTGSDTISGAAFNNPAGITVDSDSIEKSTRVHVVITLDTKGTYDLVCTASTVAGAELKQSATVLVLP